ncbi:CLUMA_CG021489, isoform A [Clunio marinus]|uniref:CLUMA_CG021489, isoform A n=1 Tax=Clunio marinus TaxID=568069 RepID=A0A1J1JC38_9DIPT|nr:CLUMA_CG021489, isoform A [Clunio marinus]
MVLSYSQFSLKRKSMIVSQEMSNSTVRYATVSNFISKYASTCIDNNFPMTNSHYSDYLWFYKINLNKIQHFNLKEAFPSDVSVFIHSYFEIISHENSN